MKEYKVISPSLGWKNKNGKLEEILNNYAKQGWVLHSASQGFLQLIFERNKNR
jgi:indole-3-glycerol phosphate synthase